MDSNDFLRMFEYDSWANRECIRAMQSLTERASSDLVRKMAHILSAEKLWLERILGQAQSMPVWPTATLEDCSALSEKNAEAWRDFLKQLSSAGPTLAGTIQTGTIQTGTINDRSGALSQDVKYRNSKGEPFSSRVGDILTHVLFHSAYHRGQIASQMRAAGFTPAYTDFIHAVREGFVE
jgi:uncharacterized damage-inducible protein DinB